MVQIFGNLNFVKYI